MDKNITIDLAKLTRKEKRMLLKLSKKSLRCEKDKYFICDIGTYDTEEGTQYIDLRKALGIGDEPFRLKDSIWQRINFKNITEKENKQIITKEMEGM